MLGRFGSNHTVQVNEQNQAAIRGNCGPRKKLHAAKIFAKVLDDDFVLAENFLNH